MIANDRLVGDIVTLPEDVAGVAVMCGSTPHPGITPRTSNANRALRGERRDLQGICREFSGNEPGIEASIGTQIHVSCWRWGFARQIVIRGSVGATCVILGATRFLRVGYSVEEPVSIVLPLRKSGGIGLCSRPQFAKCVA